MLARAMIPLGLCQLKLTKTKNLDFFGIYRAPHSDGKLFKDEYKKFNKNGFLKYNFL